MSMIMSRAAKALGRTELILLRLPKMGGAKCGRAVFFGKQVSRISTLAEIG
jgi:hypothetical protein